MLETKALNLLIAVAALTEPSSTVDLAERTGISQQSVSRLLAELDAEGLVRKKPLTTGLDVRLTEQGRLALAELHGRLGAATERRHARLTGTVERGLGEGRYYMSMPHYRDHVARLLGATPYPGTLNLAVDPAARARFLAGIERHEIPGFASRERTYGGVAYYTVRIGKEPCGLLIPLRASYGKGKVELVAGRNLRQALRLADGSTLTVEGAP